MNSNFRDLRLTSGAGIDLQDVTAAVRECIEQWRARDGVVIVSSMHTTTALVVNENEPRLLDDVRDFLARLIPKDAPYRHNDIQLRDCPPDEPLNAHSHLAAMLLSHCAVLGVRDGALALGQWQSVLMVELDGPRERTIRIQYLGT